MTQIEKRALMQTLVSQWKEGGLSQAKFATQHNLSLVKLRYWINKLGPEEDDDSAFIQINGFGTQGISLRYPNGVELILPLQTPVGVLRLLIHFILHVFPWSSPLSSLPGANRHAKKF